MSGVVLKKIIKDESVLFYVSPFQRTIETFENIAKAFGGVDNVEYRIDPRIREQMNDRRKNGAFYYRFHSGESVNYNFIKI
jgi:broad specificity phosphatase PhoE